MMNIRQKSKGFRLSEIVEEPLKPDKYLVQISKNEGYLQFTFSSKIRLF